MGRGVSAGGGQSSLGYLFGGGEAPNSSRSDPNPQAPSKPVPEPKTLATSPPVNNGKEIPAGVPATTTNNYFRADGQNCGNFLTERPSTKVHAAPGGGSSLNYLFGGDGASKQKDYMASSIKNSLGLVMMAIVVLAVMSPKSEATVRCHTVIDDLKPCLAYVTNRGPLSACCTGVGALYDLENTTKDRQRICKCLKSALKSYKHIAEAAAMTGICGVALPYEISPSTDCSRVS